MLTLSSSEDKQTCFKFIGSETTTKTTHLITDNTSLIVPLSVGENCVDSCSFYSGPSDAAIVAFGESSESCGSIAYSGSSESCGSIAFVGGSESCGSIASSVSTSSSSVSSFSGGSCSYSC